MSNSTLGRTIGTNWWIGLTIQIENTIDIWKYNSDKNNPVPKEFIDIQLQNVLINNFKK